MKIPFVNLASQYTLIQQEIDNAIQEVFAKAQFIGGHFVSEFEQSFAKTFHSRYCISTGNGTDSLYLILKALGIGPGDEVITPAFGCIASAECITLTGARVVFVDVHPDYYTIDPSRLEEKITSKTKAVIAVHLYGQAAAISVINQICHQHNLWLIEDCAQAHWSEENGKPVGTFGIASAFSFYPTKNLGAYGDAGSVLTDDTQLAEKIRRLANHGALAKDDHAFEGSNSRMDAIQAAILSVKLKHLPVWNNKRIKLAERYHHHLANLPGLSIPAIQPNTKHVFHIYAIRTPYRDELKKYLAKHGIDTRIHYPKGLPFTEAYAYKHHTTEEFPVTWQLQQQVLSLPIYPELSDDQVNYIGDAIRKFFSEARERT
jgi:dTDP-4-amino-4,6-dideoxygalactose transaminase